MADELDPLRQRLIIDAKGALVSIQNVRAKFGELGGFIGTAFRRLAIGGIAAVTAALAGAVRQAIVFGKQMAEVSTLVDTAKVSMSGLNREILKLASRTSVPLSDLTKGLYQVISAGIPAGEAIQFLETASKAAVGGVTDTKTAVDGLTTAVNAWETGAASASSVSDKFFTAVKLGKTTFGELSGSIGDVASIAKNAGLSLDEVLAATASLTLGGLETSQAMRYLRGVLVQIISPSNEAKKAFGDLLSVSALQAEGLTGWLEKLNKAAGGNIQKLSEMFESQEALTAIMGLAGSQADDFVRIMGEMARSAGAADEATRKMSNSVDQQWELIKNKWNVVLTELGQDLLPGINDVMGALIARMERIKSPGDAVVSILERMGEKSKVAAFEMKKVADMQRLMSLDKTLGEGAPVGVTGRKIEFGADIPFFFRDAAVTRERIPFAGMEDVQREQLDNLSLAGTMRDRHNEIIWQAIEQQRELTKEEQEETDTLYDQMDALRLNIEALDRYIDALTEREEIIKRMSSGPNFLGVEPLKMHGAKPTKPDAPPQVTTFSDEELEKLKAAKKALEEVRFEISLMDEPNKRLRDLMREQWEARKGINEVVELGKTRGLESVNKEINRLQEYVDLLDERILKERILKERMIQRDKGFDSVAETRDRGFRTTTSIDDEGKLQATYEFGLKLRQITPELVVHFDNLAKSLGVGAKGSDEIKTRLEEAQQAAAAIARALRDIGASPELIALVEGLSGVAGGIDAISTATSVAGQITGGVAIVGAIAGLASALKANEAEERRLHDAFVKVGRAVENYSEALLERDIIGGDLTEEQISLARNAQAELPTAGFDTGKQIIENLIGQGVISEALGEAFLEMMKSFDLSSPGGRADDALWQAFLQESGILDTLAVFGTRTGQPGDSLAAAFDRSDIAGITGTQQDQFKAFIDHLLTQDIGDALRTQLEGLQGMDLSTPEGQTALKNFIEALVTSLMAGDTRFLGGDITTDDLKDIAEYGAGFVKDAMGAGSEFTKSVQIARSVTEIRFNEWIAIAETQLTYVKDIRDMMASGSMGATGTVNVGPINLQVPAGVTDPNAWANRIMEHIEFRIRRAEKGG
jgi:TP901 family phage tail tape measure protein